MKPSPKKNLSGRADPKFYKTATDKGEASKPEYAICPIVKQINKKYEVIGTGFFITANGIFLTAEHVLSDVLDDKGNQTHPIAIFHLYENNNFLPRSILRCCRHKSADIAIGVAAQATHNTTGEYLRNKSLELCLKTPKIGETISTFAYPGSTTNKKGNKHTIRFNTDFFDGIIEDHFPQGRGWGKLSKSPCFQMNVHLHPISSGGPIVNMEGKVIGVNSSSFDGEPNLSYGIPISTIMNLTVEDIILPNETVARTAFVHELADKGLISIKE